MTTRHLIDCQVHLSTYHESERRAMKENVQNLHHQGASPDGRVLVAGGAFGPRPEEARFSWTGQIFSPPYLAKGARPTIAGAPTTVRHGREFTIETPDASRVSRVTLIGLSASSQGWNGNQRLTELDFISRSDRLKVRIPANRNLIPPGFHLLFILNARGVPSVGHMLHVGDEEIWLSL